MFPFPVKVPKKQLTIFNDTGSGTVRSPEFQGCLRDCSEDRWYILDGIDYDARLVEYFQVFSVTIQDFILASDLFLEDLLLIPGTAVPVTDVQM